MTDKPILFSAPMIRALLAGTKTQTRRFLDGHCEDPPAFVENGVVTAFDERDRPYRWPRKPGIPDRLWVKESLAARPMKNFLTGEPTNAIVAHYTADDDECLETKGFNLAWVWKRKTLNARFMPKSFSRLTLTVTDVRVQRLQDISEQDAIAEGVCQMAEDSDHPVMWEGLSRKDRTGLTVATYGSNRKAFQHLWESINGPSAWEANPWVAAVSFDVHRCNIDAMHDPSPERSTP